MGLRGWAARDKNGALYFHKDKPQRAYGCVWHADWKWHPEPEIFHLRLPKQMDIPELKWEDEPIEVELLIRKCDGQGKAGTGFNSRVRSKYQQ